jgi:hypothetical protein
MPDLIQDVLADNGDPRAGSDVSFELITHSGVNDGVRAFPTEDQAIASGRPIRDGKRPRSGSSKYSSLSVMPAFVAGIHALTAVLE